MMKKLKMPACAATYRNCAATAKTKCGCVQIECEPAEAPSSRWYSSSILMSGTGAKKKITASTSTTIPTAAYGIHSVCEPVLLPVASLP